MLKHEFIKKDSIIESDLIMKDMSRRNQNFQVTSKNGRSYLLKYGGVDKGKITSISHEAAVYRLLKQMDKAKNNNNNKNKKNNTFSSKFLPDFYYYDQREHILILELFPEAKTLYEHYTRSCRFSRTIAAKVGECLGELHQVTYDAFYTKKVKNNNGNDKEYATISQMLSEVDRLPPGVLSLHKPRSRIYLNISNANIQLIKILQSKRDICKHLDELYAGWYSNLNKYDCLIHSDIKSDNFLVIESLSPSFHSSTMNQKTRHLKLVDWEYAKIGDPAWDVGSVFSDYLGLWLLSIPITTKEASPDSFLKLARYPIHRMQPAIRSYWNAYLKKMKLDEKDSDQFLVRSVRYCSARLIQKAFEYLQDQTKISANVVYLLQVSLNIIKDPQKAITNLLGISFCKEV